ncbi:MAG: DNA primase [Oscillospiraceae bacterium]|nr:DNA primase [Oscillospiraceae bacterium]
MAFPDSFIEELLARNDISDVVSSYVQLSRKGGNLFGLCPFHNEKTPSFSVSPDKQIYHCFGCGKGGGVINFIMEIENLGYPDAIRFLANRVGMAVPEDDRGESGQLRRRIVNLNKEAARFYNSLLKEDSGKTARAYLEKRRITPQTATRFGLGAAPSQWDALIKAMKRRGYDEYELVQAGLAVKNAKGSVYDKFRDRLIFPVISVSGEVLGFGGRTLSDSEPKYLNSPETIAFSKRRTLYGINLAKNTKRGNFILCEGNIDVVTLHQAGFDNAVASMGTSLTTDQTRLISRYAKEIIICYDNDPAGIKATDRALEILKNSEFSVKVLKLPDRMVDGEKKKIDADDFIKLYGPAAFERLINGSENHIEYKLMNLQSKYDLSSPEEKVEFLKAAGQMIARLSSPVEREVYGGRAAQAAGISPEAMAQEIAKSRNIQAKKQKQEQERAETRPEMSAQPREKSLRYQNVRSATAEEGIIRLILLDPSLIHKCELESDEFSSEFLGKLFSVISGRFKNGRSIEISALAGDLSDEEMSQLVHITQKPESLANAQETMADYIRVIHTEKLKNSADLLALMNRYKETKGMEDKNSGKKG